MNALVTYQSKTGFTKKYAEWISQALACEIKELSKVNAADVENRELVIHGGWLMAGRISGLGKIKSLKPRKLIVFGVGLTPRGKQNLAECIEANKLGDTPLFYFEGGVNPPKMGFVDRLIIKMVTKMTPEYTDNTNKADIDELVERALACASE